MKAIYIIVIMLLVAVVFICCGFPFWYMHPDDRIAQSIQDYGGKITRNDPLVITEMMFDEPLFPVGSVRIVEYHSPIGSEQLRILADLKDLKEIYISAKAIDINIDLSLINDTSASELIFVSTSLNITNIADLSKCTRLIKISFIGCPIDDSFETELVKLSFVRRLTIVRTQCTIKLIDRLKQKMPNTNIIIQ